MKSWANREKFHQRLGEQLMSQANSTAYPPVLSEEIAHWLGKVSLLYGVPIEYLVPDERMLPAESLRFFYLDRNWLDRLVDGALSVGVLSTADQVFNKSFFEQIYAQVDVAQRKVRSIIRDEHVSEPTEIGGTMTGILMRSQVVSDYPGVEINGYDKAGNLLEILRMDRLANSLLICIFQGRPEKVDFIEPSEGLHFGVTRDNTTQKLYISLRGLGFPKDVPQGQGGYEAGVQIETSPGSKHYLKAEVQLAQGAAAGVVDVAKTVAGFESILQGLTPNALQDPQSGKDNLTPGGFAIQMVVSAGFQSYEY